MAFFQKSSLLLSGVISHLLKKYQAARPVAAETMRWSTGFTEVVSVSYGEPDGRLTRYIQ